MFLNVAVFASPDGISFPHSTFYDLPFHSFPSNALILQTSTWLLSLLLSTDTMQAAYLIPSLLFPLFPPPSAFCSIFNVQILVFQLPFSQRVISFRVLSNFNLVLPTVFMMSSLGGTGTIIAPPLFPMPRYSFQITCASSSSPLLAVCPRNTGEFPLL